VVLGRWFGDSLPGVVAEAAVLVAGYAGATLLLQRRALAELRRGGLR
jgi:PST family polysaccharide transporter